MKLKVNYQQVQQTVVGIQAGIVKDDVNGSVLVIQQDTQQLRLKLSDLVSFITEQEKPVVNPEAEGSKGESELE